MHSQNLEAAAATPSLKKNLMEHLLDDHEDYPNRHENTQKLCDEKQYPFFEFQVKSIEMCFKKQSVVMCSGKEIF